MTDAEWVEFWRRMAQKDFVWVSDDGRDGYEVCGACECTYYGPRRGYRPKDGRTWLFVDGRPRRWLNWVCDRCVEANWASWWAEGDGTMVKPDLDKKMPYVPDEEAKKRVFFGRPLGEYNERQLRRLVCVIWKEDELELRRYRERPNALAAVNKALLVDQRRAEARKRFSCEIEAAETLVERIAEEKAEGLSVLTFALGEELVGALGRGAEALEAGSRLHAQAWSMKN